MAGPVLRSAIFGGALLVLTCSTSAASDVHLFDIQPQDADQALADFGLQANRQIVAPGITLTGIKAHAVHGTFETSTALAILLQDAPVDVLSDDGETIVLRSRARPVDATLFDARGVMQPIESVIVTDYRASLADAARAKRSSVQFSDTVFAENFGKFADSNIAEAFNRIPGITISREVDGSGVNVSVRGLGANFTRVLLNGSPIAIASTGPTNASNANREVDLNVFPTELFTELSVSKSARAADLEGAAAGILNMRSRRPFDNPGLHLTYSIKGIDLVNQNAVSPDAALVVSATAGGFGVLLGATTTASRLFTTGFEAVGWTNANLTTSGTVIQCSPAASCNTTGGGNWSIPTVVPDNVTTGGLTPGHVIDQAYLLSMNPGLTISQIDNALVPRLGRIFREKGVRSHYNGVLNLEYWHGDEVHIYFDTIAARISNAFDRSALNFVIRNGAAIPVAETVNSHTVVTSATFANAQLILEARPYHERGDFFSINPGIEWRPSEHLQIVVQTNTSRSHFLRDVPSIVLSTAPSEGNPTGVPGATAPNGGLFVTYVLSKAASTPQFSANIDINDPANFQWYGGRVNLQAEKRYTFTNGIHADVTYGTDILNLKTGVTFDQAHRVITAYDNSQAWQNAVCGNQPNVYLAAPNSQPPCEGLAVSGSADLVNSVASGYPTYPGLGTYYSAAASSLSYSGSLIPQSSLASYLRPGPASFVAVDYGKFMRDAHFSEFAYPNAPEAASSNLGVSAGMLDEKSYGAYGEINGIVALFANSLRFNVGLRWVKTHQLESGPISTQDSRNSGISADGAYYPTILNYISEKRSYHSFLPAINLVYELSDTTQIRASLSRTMTRPNPSDIMPGLSFSDPSAAQVSIGNTLLSPYFSNNVDVGMEIYTGEEGYFAINLLHKSVSGFTITKTTTRPFSFLDSYGITYETLTSTQQTAIDARGGATAATIQVSQQVNADGELEISGLELTYLQPLDSILGRYGLSGFGISGNLTVIGQSSSRSDEVKAIGISPYTYNLTAYYEKDDVNLRASYVFNDKQLASGTNTNGICLPSTDSSTCPQGAYLYNAAYAQLDFSVTLKLAPYLGSIPTDPELIFSIQNVTKSKIRTYFQYPEATQYYYAPGATVIFGIHGSF